MLTPSPPTATRVARWAHVTLAAAQAAQAQERADLRTAANAQTACNHLENLAYYTGQVHALQALLRELPELVQAA